MRECKNCGKLTHNKQYCSRSCSNSSRSLSEETRKKISLSMKTCHNEGRYSGHPMNTSLSKEHRSKISEGIQKYFQKQYDKIKRSLPFEEWPRKLILDTMFFENGYICEECGYSYRDPKTRKGPFEIHHLDGNKNNWKRENLKILCLNCHWKTPNYRFRGRKHSEEYKNQVREENKVKFRTYFQKKYEGIL